jgi:hypothetical protein
MGVVKLSTAGILDYSKTSNFLSGNAPLSLGSFDLLETTTLTSSASSVTFSGLGAYTDYKHLQIRMVGRSNRSGFSTSNIDLRINGDTGSNYSYHSLFTDGANVYSTADGVSSDKIRTEPAITAATATSGDFSARIYDFLDFSSASKNTTVRVLAGSAVKGIGLSSGAWLNTAAVTSLTLIDAQGSFIAGSRFSLYGVKGTV